MGSNPPRVSFVLRWAGLFVSFCKRPNNLFPVHLFKWFILDGGMMCNHYASGLVVIVNTRRCHAAAVVHRSCHIVRVLPTLSVRITKAGFNGQPMSHSVIKWLVKSACLFIKVSTRTLIDKFIGCAESPFNYETGGKNRMMKRTLRESHSCPELALFFNNLICWWWCSYNRLHAGYKSQLRLLCGVLSKHRVLPVQTVILPTSTFLGRRNEMSQVKALSILSMVVNVLGIACMMFFDFWKGVEVLQVGILVIILAGVLHVVNWGKKNYE